MDDIILRPYQQECVDIINSLESGSYLITMATGLGKTVCFSRIKRRGRVLILSHRDELVRQPIKYYDCPCGIEKAGEHSNGEEVVSASVQTLWRRLNKFQPDDFDTIITDEAHHAVAPTYQKIYDYFKPRLHLGFTATPNRNDKIGLKKIYSSIIFEKNLKWAIKNHYLSDIKCTRINMGYDLKQVKKSMGDFAVNSLAEAIDTPSANKLIGEIYKKHAEGPTLIFAATVKHAMHIAENIPNAEVITADTPDRAEILKRFLASENGCIVNCMVLTEGTDLPNIKTIIMARPTANESLYAQMVGRGTRLYPGKEHLNLIDCVGTSRLSICTAPSLFGLDDSSLPASKKKQLNGLMLTNMEDAMFKLYDTPKMWIMNEESVNVFANEINLNLHGIRWTKMPDTSMVLSLPGERIVMSAMNNIGECDVKRYPTGAKRPITICKDQSIQLAVNATHKYLSEKRQDCISLWNKRYSVWENGKASEKQQEFIKSLMKRCKMSEEELPENYTKGQASIIIEHLKNIVDRQAPGPKAKQTAKQKKFF